VVRDQHGHPLPDGDFGDSERSVLIPEQVDQALGGLPGWRRLGTTLRREIAVEPASAAGLREGVLRAAGPNVAIAVDDAGQRATIVVGTDREALDSADVEAAARIDAVLSGSAGDRGSV